MSQNQPLTKGEVTAHIVARELGRRVRKVHERITAVEVLTTGQLAEIDRDLASIRSVDTARDRQLDALRESVGTLSGSDALLFREVEEQRQVFTISTDAIAEIDARLRINETTDALQDVALETLDQRVVNVEARSPVPGPKGDKGEPGPLGPRGPRGSGGGASFGGAVTTFLSGGAAVASRGNVNFVSGATVTDDAANNRVNITVSGGGGNVNSVSVSSGLSITGTSDLTITNTGVRSLAASGISVSSATGEVTITAPTVSGGAGITVAGSGTTSLTVSATGVNSVSGGTGISVSGTTALTVSATGVNSIVAGTGIAVSG